MRIKATRSSQKRTHEREPKFGRELGQSWHNTSKVWCFLTRDDSRTQYRKQCPVGGQARGQEKVLRLVFVHEGVALREILFLMTAQMVRLGICQKAIPRSN